MRWTRVLAAAGVVLGGAALLGGCLFVRAPEAPGPALVVGQLLGAVGQEVEIPLEIVAFPTPGVGGVALLELGYDPAVLEVLGIEGRDGFVVLCSCVNNATGQVKCALVNPSGGVTTGPVGTLRGRRVGLGDPKFRLDPTNVQVVDAANRLVPGAEYAIRLGGAFLYWVKR